MQPLEKPARLMNGCWHCTESQKKGLWDNEAQISLGLNERGKFLDPL